MTAKKKRAGKPRQGPIRDKRIAARGGALATFAAEDPGKGIAVATAIGTELTNDRRWPPNDLNKVMGSDYRYGRDTMSNLLGRVRWHLAYGNPQYFFSFDLPFIDAALNQSVAELIGSVDAATTSEVAEGWTWP